MDAPSVAVSWGELIDKITILEIKDERLAAEAARRNVKKELSLLNRSATKTLNMIEIRGLKDELSRINTQLWDIEDQIRAKEAQQQFDQEFIELARSVYKTNDVRTAIKRRINEVLSSELMEEKSYAVY
ncbi:MAG: DUF6165 family protein [Aestuariivirga sp.]|nr:DUF6165 family protein [Aestuariivirga sp.]